MLALIKEGDDLIVPDVNGKPIRLAATLEEQAARGLVRPAGIAVISSRSQRRGVDGGLDSRDGVSSRGVAVS
jgi:hypothetical protein